jgi:hypothetical protein
LVHISIAITKENRVRASIKAKAKSKVVRISPEASGCRAIPSMARAAAFPCPKAEPKAAIPMAKPTPINPSIFYPPLT